MPTLPVKKPGRRFRFEEEAEALACAARAVGVEVLAAHLDKRPGSLLNELTLSHSPETGHKLGFDDALSLMMVSGDFTSLHIFLRRLDFNVVPRRQPPSDARFHAVLRLLEKSGEYASCLADVLADGKITDEEWAQLGKITHDIENIVSVINAHRKPTT